MNTKSSDAVTYMILSDIHANIEALAAIINVIPEDNPDYILNLGDSVGYGPNPNEVVDLLRTGALGGIPTISILGNHCEAIIKEDYSRFNPIARSVAVWTHKKLTSEKFSFLKSLDFKHSIPHDKIYLSHGAIHDAKGISLETYLIRKSTTPKDIEVSLATLATKHMHVGCVGHTHQRALRFVQLGQACIDFTEYKHGYLDAEPVYTWTANETPVMLINPSSVGQARDGLGPEEKPVARYALLTVSHSPLSYSVEFKCVPYDITTTLAKLRQGKFPQDIGTRMEYGC